MSWIYLEKLWKRTTEPNTGTNTDTSSWDKEIEILYRLGISMEDALQFLYFKVFRKKLYRLDMKLL